MDGGTRGVPRARRRRQAAAARQQGLDVDALRQALAIERAATEFDLIRRDYNEAVDRQIRALSENTLGLQALGIAFGQQRRSLLIAPGTTLDPGAQLSEARSQFTTLAARVRDTSLPIAERERAGQELQGVAQSLLGISSRYYGSGTGYAEDFGLVVDTLEQLEQEFVAGADVATRQLEELQAQRADINRLGERQLATTDALYADSTAAYARLLEAQQGGTAVLNAALTRVEQAVYQTAQIETMKAQINGLTNTVGSLQGQIGSLNGTIADLQAQIANLNTQVANANAGGGYGGWGGSDGGRYGDGGWGNGGYGDNGWGGWDGGGSWGSDGGWSGGFAKGAAFHGGNVVPFALGGVVPLPTLFPMAGGRTGLMGEAGPEAIMPLTRTPTGHLGVRAQNDNAGVIASIDGTNRALAAMADALARGFGMMVQEQRATREELREVRRRLDPDYRMAG
jgi:hypothetical protein